MRCEGSGPQPSGDSNVARSRIHFFVFLRALRGELLCLDSPSGWSRYDPQYTSRGAWLRYNSSE